MQRAVVDFPQPDSPTMPRVRPRSTSKETSATAETTCSRFLENKLAPRWNSLARWRTEITGSFPPGLVDCEVTATCHTI